MSLLLDKWRLLLKIIVDPAMTGADKAVAAVLLDLLGGDGVASPSIPTIAERTGRSCRTAKRSIARLTAAGYFTATDSRGRGNTKTYRPNFRGGLVR
jgi:pyocin large subunit-like protein